MLDQVNLLLNPLAIVLWEGVQRDRVPSHFATSIVVDRLEHCLVGATAKFGVESREASLGRLLSECVVSRERTPFRVSLAAFA